MFSAPTSINHLPLSHSARKSAEQTNQIHGERGREPGPHQARGHVWLCARMALHAGGEEEQGPRDAQLPGPGQQPPEDAQHQPWVRQWPFFILREGLIDEM